MCRLRRRSAGRVKTGKVMVLNLLTITHQGVRQEGNYFLALTRDANMDTQTSDISAEEIRESGRSFQSLIVCGKKILCRNYKANISDTEAPFLDLHLSVANGFVSSKIYDKRDDFDFDIVIFPFLDGDVPRRASYGVYISQLIRFA